MIPCHARRPLLQYRMRRDRIDALHETMGECIAWSPTSDAIAFIEDYKVVVVDFPSGNKRTIYDDSVGGRDYTTCVHWAQ